MQKIYIAENVSLIKKFIYLNKFFTFLLVSLFLTSSFLNAQITQRVIGPNERSCVKKTGASLEEYNKAVLADRQAAESKHQTLVALKNAQRENNLSFVEACVPGNILIDPGFETTNGGTYVNPSWPSTSTNFGSSFCDVAGCGTGGGTAGPRNGNFWAWFGGISAAEIGTVQQTVIIPSGSTATLNYYLRIGSVIAPFDATLKIMVDGVTQTTIAEPATAEAAYTLRTLDLTAFANDLPHTIRFEYNNPAGSGISNFNLDDVTLDIVCLAGGCTGVPSPGFITGPLTTICSGASATLTCSGFTSGSGITFQWKSSANAGGPYTAISGATNSTYTFTTNTTAYYICTVTCTNSSLAANTTEFAVNVSKPVHSAVSATPTTTCTPGAAAITGTVSGGSFAGGIGILGSSGTINLAIPDNNPTGVSHTITLPASSIPAAGSLKIRINATHTWVGDLVFKITSPCGITYLFDRPGVPTSSVGNSANLGGIYTFDLSAATVIPESGGGTTIAPGSYLPSNTAGSSHTWAGLTFPCSTAGAWTITITDGAGGDTGTLIDWTILGPAANNYTHAMTGPGTITQNPSTGTNSATANFSVTGLPAGVHTFVLTSTDGIGCSVSSNVTVTVNQTPTVTITPAAPVICAGAIQQLVGGAVPAITQTFSSGAINLAIPDNNPTGVTTAPITLPAGINISAASGLRVSINARHSWVGDLKFTLTSPCGTTFLFDRPGVPPLSFGNSANLGTSSASTPPPAVYVFDLAAATVIPESGPAAGFIPTGSYKPSDVNGAAHNWAGLTFPCAGTGNWTLTVADNGGGDTGALIDWAILLDTPSPVVFTPVTNLFTNAGATTPYVAGTPVNSVWTNTTTTTTYTATATQNGCTSAPVNVIVTVNQLPAITVQPVALAAPVCAGFNVNYSVTATGTGVTYQWQVSTDAGATFNNIANGVQYAGVTTSSLTLINVALGMNNYRYRCVVSGTCPPAVNSSAVTLVVATPPTITTHPANVTVCAKANATFSVVAAGVPAPTLYQWQVSTAGAGGPWTNLTIAGAFSPSLTLIGVATTQNSYQYRCVVTNTCGQTVTSNPGILTVNALPVVSAGTLPARICISDTLIALSGLPVGGSWKGIGISGFNFVPAATAVGGPYTLTYINTNTLGCTDSASILATVLSCPERARLLRDDAVIIYPNPNKGVFSIRVNSTLYNYLGIRVFNAAGVVVNGTSVNDVLTSPTYSGLVYGRVIPINLSHLPAGTYLVKVYYEDGVRTAEKSYPVLIIR